MLKLSRLVGIRDGVIVYIVWRCICVKFGIFFVFSSGNLDFNVLNGSIVIVFVIDCVDVKKDEGDVVNDVVDDDDLLMLVMGWDMKMFIW